MNKCIDCIYFDNTEGFSVCRKKISMITELSTDPHDCTEFKPRKIIAQCFTCTFFQMPDHCVATSEVIPFPIIEYHDCDSYTIKESSALDIQVGGGHYKDFEIQPVEFCQKNKLGFCEANVVKYITRHTFKNGRQDLEKAKHYIDLLLELEYGISRTETS